MEVRLTPPAKELLEELDRRKYVEREARIRTEAQRDRDRILYSSALLRLGHVTQVAAPEVGHTFHSRLTHSLKVAQVARGLAQRLKTLRTDGELEPVSARLIDALDEDATEAAALAHDLGHPPFGHLAETVLQKRSTAATFEGIPSHFESLRVWLSGRSTFPQAADRLFDGFVSSVRTRFSGRAEERINLRAVGSALIGRYIAAVEVRDEPQSDAAILAISEDVRDEVAVLKSLTWFYIIDRPSLAIIQRGHARVIDALYTMYRDALKDRHLDVFPPESAEHVERAEGDAARERVVIDLIASMTEASATEIYKQHLGVSHGSLIARTSGPA